MLWTGSGDKIKIWLLGDFELQVQRVSLMVLFVTFSPFSGEFQGLHLLCIN